jgi:hypothetical protein
MKEYYRTILAQILDNERPKIKELIDTMFEDGYDLEGTTIYSFESLRIHEALQFLEDNWEHLQEYLI